MGTPLWPALVPGNLRTCLYPDMHTRYKLATKSDACNMKYKPTQKPSTHKASFRSALGIFIRGLCIHRHAHCPHVRSLMYIMHRPVYTAPPPVRLPTRGSRHMHSAVLTCSDARRGQTELILILDLI